MPSLTPLTGDMQVSLHGGKYLTILGNPSGRPLTIIENFLQERSLRDFKDLIMMKGNYSYHFLNTIIHS